MTIVHRFNTTAAMLAALSAGFILLAPAGAHAGSHSHQSMAAASGHVANSPPIIAKPGHDDHGNRHGHHRGLGFGFAQTYWLVDNPCELHRAHLDQYTDVVIVRRVKPCAFARNQTVIVPEIGTVTGY